MSSLNELIKTSLKGSVILSSVPYGGGFSVVRLDSNSSVELMDWLYKDYIDALPHLIFMVPHTFSMLEFAIAHRRSPYSSLFLPDIVLRPSEYFNSRYEVVEFVLGIECQVFP